MVGNQRYVIYLRQPLVSSKGLHINPGNDSIEFFTFPIEREPNDISASADTVSYRRFGSVATVNDTDRFIVIDEAVGRVFCNSEGSRTTFILADDSGFSSYERNFKYNDTIPVPAELSSPFFIVVFARVENGDFWGILPVGWAHIGKTVRVKSRRAESGFGVFISGNLTFN